jgi:hypothetical protein
MLHLVLGQYSYGMDGRGSVSIATGWMAADRFWAGARDFSPLHSIQAGAGAHSAPYPMGTGGSVPGGEAGHSPPVSADVGPRHSSSG